MMWNRAYQTAWVGTVVVLTAYCLVFLQFSPPLLQDYPNHLARAVVVSDLLFHGGARFGGLYQFDFMAVPYVLHDLLLAIATEVLGFNIAARAASLLVFLSLPCALLCHMRAANIRREDQILAVLLSVYVASDTFYLRGFLAFSLAVSAIIALLALVRLLRRRFSPITYGAYCALLAVGYLLHLTTLVFLAAAIAVCAALAVWRRAVNPRTEILIFLPIVALLFWHFVLRHPVPVPAPLLGAVPEVGAAHYHWGTFIGKIQHLDWISIRFNHRADRWMLWLGIVCVLWQSRHLRHARANAAPYAVEMFVLALTFAAIYVVLPSNAGNWSWVDERALPMAAIFLMMATLSPAPGEPSSRRALGTAFGLILAATLAVANLVYLNTHLRRLDAWLAEYRAVVAAVPVGAWVLPVYTNTNDRPIKSTLHAAAFTVIDRRAPNPYLFSLDLGDSMEYFRYHRRPYAPDESWYFELPPEGVDWQTIARSYDYLLVMKPFDPTRIRIATTPVVDNAVAALLAVAAGSPVKQ